RQRPLFVRSQLSIARSAGSTGIVLSAGLVLQAYHHLPPSEIAKARGSGHVRNTRYCSRILSPACGRCEASATAGSVGIGGAGSLPAPTQSLIPSGLAAEVPGAAASTVVVLGVEAAGLVSLAWRCGNSLIQSTGIAKLRFCASPTEPSVVRPISTPSSSNRPPPLEPREIGAEVCSSKIWP